MENPIKMDHLGIPLLGQWLTFKFFGITYLVGKISRSNGFFFQGPGRLSELGCELGVKLRVYFEAQNRGVMNGG